MAFTLSGSTITQSGTDTSLAGLTGVAGVTTRTVGAGVYKKVYYTLPNGTNLTYNNLTLDPRYECLVLGQTACLITPSSSSSVLNIGSNLTQFGGTYGSQQEAIVSGDNSGVSYTVSSGLKIFQGTLNWYYGTIRVQTCTGLGAVDYNNGNVESTLTGYIGGNAILEIMTIAGDSCQVQFGGDAGLVVEGLKLRGYGSPTASGMLSISTGRIYTQAPSFQLEGFAGISYQAGSAGAQPVLASTVPAIRQSQFFTTYGFKSTAGPKGLNIWLGSLIRGVNCPDGSAVKILEHNNNSSHSQGYVEIRNEALFTQKDVAGAAIQGVVTYMRDTNNGSRKLYNLCQQNIDNTGDKIYIATSNASGIAGFTGDTGSVLLCAVAHLTASYVGSDNTGHNLKDLRSKTNVPGTDDFTFYHWGYGFAVRATDVILKSTTTAFEQTNALVADPGVTLSQTAAAALSSISTLDNLYDAAKNWKCQAVQANLEYPTIGTQPITASGNVLNLGSCNIVIDSAASSAFAINTGTNTVTIKAATLATGAKFASITTTGSITFANGGTISASYTDASGTRVTLKTADSLSLSSYVTINGVPQGWQAGLTERVLFVQPASVVRIYAHAYGYQPKIVNVTGNTASDYVISLAPETLVDTSLSTSVRDAIATQISIGVDGFSRLFMAIGDDLSQYTPEEVINALHYFTVTQGHLVAAVVVAANSVAGFALGSGAVVIRSPGFYGKVNDSVTTVGNRGVYVPLYLDVDPSVYVAMPTYSPVEKNTSGIVLGTALWTKETAVISATDKSDIRNGLAREATVLTRATQTSADLAVANAALAVALSA